jgi:hypothetical protein
MQLTTADLERFIGGQISVEGYEYTYRGEIATAVVEDDKLKVTCAWMARKIEDGGHDYHWVEDTHHLDLQINLDFYISHYITGLILMEAGIKAVSLDSEFLGEHIFLFPPEGSNLNRREVRGLDPVTT